MKKYGVIKVSSMWSTHKLMHKAEKAMNNLDEEGYDVLDVSYGHSVGGVPSFFITYKDKTLTEDLVG